MKLFCPKMSCTRCLAVFQMAQELPRTVIGTSELLKKDEFSKAAVSYASLHLPEGITALFTNKEDNL